MKRVLLLCAAAGLVAGCGGTMREWQRQPMPSHDRQRVFEAARAVLESHFEIADANFVRGTIETRPQVFDRPRGGTLADLRGAGGRWRRIVSFRMEREGLTVVAEVAVRLQREATEAALAMAEQHRTAPEDEFPALPPTEAAVGRGDRAVWMDVGWDAALARELLSAIAERVQGLERAAEVPVGGQSPAEAAEEVRRLDAQRRR